MKNFFWEYYDTLSNSSFLMSQSLSSSPAMEELELGLTTYHSNDSPLTILQNYFTKHNNNPRAVNCFIFYDITNNKLRRQISKYLLEKGCQRIQKSVLIGNLNKKIYDEIFEAIKSLNAVLDSEDSIIFVPIGEYHLAEMRLVGKEVDMEFSRSKKWVIFI